MLPSIAFADAISCFDVYSYIIKINIFLSLIRENRQEQSITVSAKSKTQNWNNRLRPECYLQNLYSISKSELKEL